MCIGLRCSLKLNRTRRVRFTSFPIPSKLSAKHIHPHPPHNICLLVTRIFTLYDVSPRNIRFESGALTSSENISAPSKRKRKSAQTFIIGNNVVLVLDLTAFVLIYSAQIYPLFVHSMLEYFCFVGSTARKQIMKMSNGSNKAFCETK